MADLVVGMAKSVVDGALTKAQAAIEEDTKLRQSAQRNLVFITGEFQMMKSFLNIADSERLKNPVVRTWVLQIRELAYDVEDCIEFVVHLDKKNRWWLRVLKPASWFLRPCVDLSRLLSLDLAVVELEQLKARVEDVSSRNARYSLINSDSVSKPATTAAQPASGDTVGMMAVNRLIQAANTDREELNITRLLPKKDHDLGVISIWGTGVGDLGMPSIAWNTYTDKETCKNFVWRAWVKLTHPFDPQEFIHSLTAQFHANSCKEEPASSPGGRKKMEDDFKQLLTENRYLVVLEDLSTVAEWAAIKRFFPKEKNGSCIILSTQQFEVASLSVGHPYQVLHLNQLSAADHSVYAFFTEESQYDGDRGMTSQTGQAGNSCKRAAANRWIYEHPLVGRELDMKDLDRNVITTRGRSYQVMSVWGFTGVGKSALVMNTYCKEILKGDFQKYAWVDVSHPFNLWDFSRTLLSSFGSRKLQDSEHTHLYSMGSQNPIPQCREILTQQTCLVIIDGLQSTIEWDLIKAELVSGSNRRNVIIIVTTEQEIATYCRGDKGHLVLNVKGLEADTAVELFEKVSKKGKVAEIGELTSICGGLPKVIVEIAGSFAKNTDRWKDALSNNKKFMLELENNGEFLSLRGLLDWMNSSFRNYADSLKSCILYLPVFPRNHLIRRRRLVRRWIAEGYSRDNHEESAEMVGEEHFNDLVDLRIIQQSSLLGMDDTRMDFCQVNGFFREYIVSHQMEGNLVLELRGNCVLTSQRTGRHLAISENWVRDRIVFESIDFSRLRSLTVFGKWKSFFIYQGMKLLRVLDLEDASEVEHSDLKKMVKFMCRLKFLSLRGHHEIKHLPSSIGDLRQLESLDVRHTSILTLPESIIKLQKLQYIRAGTKAPSRKTPTPHHLLSQLSSYCSGRQPVGVVVPPGIGKLTALHTLGVINVRASGTKAVLEDAKKLTHLRKLGVSGINKNNSNKFFLAISDILQLESLSVQIEDNNESCLNGTALPLESLRSLKLYGLGDRLPDWRAQLTKLTKMDLEIAKLTEDHVSMQPEGRREHTSGVIKFLSELPGLCILRLRVHHLQDNQLDVSIIYNDLELDSFEKLKIFEIACSFSSKVTFGEKTMKKLEQLKFECCSGSTFFGLEYLAELKEVLLKGARDEQLMSEINAKLENHPKVKKPVVKLEEKPSSS
ncbi:disease resistance protein Pik-2 isoform X1 [Aegilops tauschii subsp. strangulata]|uniref:Disease resistance protein RPM1 n=2 Tax=Aegilops tauschii subsp. strangulata TaxID=200361 RepID=A0A452XBU1_AEGTS|nr:disease resistance protein Pik-2 isoform X1 [Aegilops tauschii subsp. strangulata]